MDPASFALTVLPLVGGSIATYKTLRSRVNDFRHYSREVGRFRRCFELQRDIFLNEMELFLRSITKDASIAKSMMDNEDPSCWNDATLEDNIRKHMDRSVGSFCNVMEDIEFVLGKFSDGLDCFRLLEAERQDVCSTGRN